MSNLGNITDVQKAREYARQDLPALLALCTRLIKNASEAERESYAAAISDEALAAKTIKGVVRAFAIDDEPAMRIFASQMLQHCSPDDDVFLGLAQWLATDGDQTVATAGFEVLGRWFQSNNHIYEIVIGMLHSEFVRSRQAAIHILANTTPDTATLNLLKDALQDDNEDIRQIADETFKKWDTGRNTKALRRPNQKRNDTDSKTNRFTTRKQSNQSPAVETLLKALQNENWLIRQRAVDSLGKLGDISAIESLLLLLQDDNTDVRQSTTQALGQLGDARAVEPLLSALQDRNANVRQSAVQALGQLGDVRAVESLLIMLQDKSANVRQSAARALGQLGDSRAVEPLLLVLEDKNENVQESAALALGQIGRGNMEIFSQLESLASESTADLSYSACLAINALIALAPERAFCLAEKNINWFGHNLKPRSLFLEIIGRSAFLGVEKADKFIRVWSKSEKASERAASAALLGEFLPIKPEEIFATLEPLASADDWTVREAVAIPLARRSLFSMQIATKILRALGEDDEIAVAFSASIALGQIVGERDVIWSERRFRRYAQSSRRKQFLERLIYKMQDFDQGGFVPFALTRRFFVDNVLPHAGFDRMEELDLADLAWQKIETYQTLEARVKNEETEVEEARAAYDQHQKNRERWQGSAALGAIIAILALVIDLVNRLINSDNNALGIILPACAIGLIIVVGLYVRWGARSRELGAWLLEVEDFYMEDRQKLREVLARYGINSIDELIQRRLQPVELGLIGPELFYEEKVLSSPERRKVNRKDVQPLLQQLGNFVIGRSPSLDTLEKLLRLLTEPLAFYVIYKQVPDEDRRSACRLYYDLASLIDKAETAELPRGQEENRLRKQLPKILDRLVQGFRELAQLEYGEKHAIRFFLLHELLMASSLAEILRALVATKKELRQHQLREEEELWSLINKLDKAVNPLRQYGEAVTISLRTLPLSEAISNLEEAARFISFEGTEPYRTIILQAVSNWRDLLRLEIRRFEGEARLEFSALEEVTAGETITVVLEIRNYGPAPANNFKVQLQGKTLIGVEPAEQTIPSLAANESKTLTFSTHSRAKRFIAEFFIIYDDLTAKAKTQRFTATISVREPLRVWRKISNPYLPGLPAQEAVERLFVGRDDVLNVIEENLIGAETERIVVLYGHRRTGKTWVLLRLQERLPSAYLPVYIDVQEFTGVNGVPAILQIFTDEILRTLKEKGKLEAAAFSGIRIPTFEQYEQNYAYHFKRVFLNDVQQKLGERKLLWLIDEFQGLDDMVASGNLPATFMEFLRDLMQFGKKMAFIFAGTREMTGQYWSVFFNIAIQRKIGVLNDTEAAKLIIDPVKPLGVEHDRFAVPFIKQLTGNHPYFIQLLCDRIVSELNARRQMKACPLRIMLKQNNPF